MEFTTDDWKTTLFEIVYIGKSKNKGWIFCGARWRWSKHVAYVDCSWIAAVNLAVHLNMSFIYDAVHMKKDRLNVVCFNKKSRH